MVTQVCNPPPHTVEEEARDRDEFEASFELLSCLADLKGWLFIQSRCFKTANRCFSKFNSHVIKCFDFCPINVPFSTFN